MLHAPSRTHAMRNLPAFVFEARPVIAIEDAVLSEMEVIAWRDELKQK